MSLLDKIQSAWNKRIDAWMLERVDSIPEEERSLDGTRDCWRGLVLPLFNQALTIAGFDNVIPDRVTDEQVRQEQRYIGKESIEIFGDMASVVPKSSMRPGDVAVFIFKKRTHVALILDRIWAAHATDGGVHRMKRDAINRLDIKVLRYNGPGAEAFAV